jgi:hypothetical protein
MDRLRVWRLKRCCGCNLLLVRNMNQHRGFFDGRVFLTKSAFRSGHFFLTSVMGLGAIALVGFILVQFSQSLNVYVEVILAVPIGAQILYQWLRTRRYYSKIRELYSKRQHDEPVEESSLEEALKTAAGGIAEVLFYSYGMILCCLAVIAALLAHR